MSASGPSGPLVSLIFSDLKLGFFHPNIGEKKRFGIGNITV